MIQSYFFHVLHVDGHGLDTYGLDAKRNWWGTTDSDVIKSRVYDFFSDAGVIRADISEILDSDQWASASTLPLSRYIINHN